MRIRTTAAVAAVVLLAHVCVSAQVYSSLALLINAEQYAGDVYAAPPPSDVDYVYYIGEPILLRLDVLNTASVSRTFVSRGADVSSNFVSIYNNATTTLRSQIPLANDVKMIGPRGTFLVPFERSMPVEPKTKLQWIASIQSGQLTPGRYALEIQCLAVDEDGRSIAPVGSRFAFELRATTMEVLAEIHRRAAARAFLEGRHADARREISELLAIHPRSAIAHGLLGDIYFAENDKAQALLNYRRMQGELLGGGDALLLQFRGPRQVAEMRGIIAESIKRAEK